MRWAHSIITPATIEVISLDEAKAELDVTFNDDDALIIRQLAAAIQFVEGYTSTFLAPTVVELQLDRFPALASPRLTLPFGPVQSVASVQYSSAGVLTAFTDYAAIQGEVWALTPNYGTNWPYIVPTPGAVRVQFTAGYADGQCPEGLIQAVMVALRAYYEAPDPSSIDSQLEAARGVAAPYKLGWLP